MFACLLLISCDPVPELPTVVIKEIKDVASMSAKVVFEITNDGVEVYTTYKPRYIGHPIRPVID